jgi:hypothetical protein
MELDVWPAPSPEDVIVGSGVQREVEGSFPLEIIFAVGELKMSTNELNIDRAILPP